MKEFLVITGVFAAAILMLVVVGGVQEFIAKIVLAYYRDKLKP